MAMRPTYPREEHDLISWWIAVSREDWPAAIAAHRLRWETSKLARMLVPASGVPTLEGYPKRFARHGTEPD